MNKRGWLAEWTKALRRMVLDSGSSPGEVHTSFLMNISIVKG